jgi:hypothetical protein
MLLFPLSEMILANMVWPAVYVVFSLHNFWYVVIITIAIETYCIFVILKTTVKQSILISCIANLSSFVVGIWFLVFFMFFSHLILDSITGRTFSAFNKAYTIVFMLFASIIIEVFIIRIIWHFPLKKLFICLSIGNLLSYLFTAIYLYALGGWEMQM